MTELMDQIVNKPPQESNKYFSSATSARSATTHNKYAGLHPDIMDEFHRRETKRLRIKAILEANAQALADSLAEPKDYATEYQASLLREITSLPKLHQKILWLMLYDFECEIEFWDRSLAELGRRFHRHPKVISKALCELEDWGFIKGKGKRRLFKNRWITCAGRRKLDIQRKLKTRSLKSPIPYIDLLSLKREEKSLIKIGPQICGQLYMLNEQSTEDAFEEALKSFILTNEGTENVVNDVKAWFKRAAATLKEKINILKRSVAANAKKRIGSFTAYFKTCLHNASILRKIHITLAVAHFKNPALVPLYKIIPLQYSNYTNLGEIT